jgi:hypothetical protein
MLSNFDWLGMGSRLRGNDVQCYRKNQLRLS